MYAKRSTRLNSISDERGRMKSEHTKDAESKEANRAAAEVTTIQILRKKRGNGCNGDIT